MSAPFVLASKFSEIDREFPTIEDLARGVRELCGRWNITARVIPVASALDVSHFPGGRCLRLRTAAMPGKGSIVIGWAILPGYRHGIEEAARDMAVALDAVTQEREAA